MISETQETRVSSERVLNQPWAEPVNWEAPVMSSRERATTFFRELSEFAQGQIDKLNAYKKSLENAGIWDIFLEKYTLEQDGISILKEWRSDLPFFPEGIGFKTRAMLSDAIVKSNNEERARLLSIERKFQEWLANNADKLSEMNRKMWDWEDGQKLPSKQDALFLTSPYFAYLLTHLDELSSEQFVQECKNSYRQLTVDDYVSAIDQALANTPQGETTYVYVQPRKSREDIHIYKHLARREQQRQKYFSSDEFMVAFIEARAKQKGLKVQILRTHGEILTHFAANNDVTLIPETISKIKSSHIIVLDDAAYSGDQKAEMRNGLAYFRDFGLTSAETEILNAVLPEFRDKTEYYFVGLSERAKKKFLRLGLHFHYQKLLPSVSQTMAEPHLTLLRQMWYVYGSFPFSMKSHEEPEDVEGLETQWLSKPVTITPFKTPDWMSMQKFWMESVVTQTMLFSLATDQDEAPSAYINPEDLLEGYRE